jgi:prephenate dehydrogenase
MNIVVVGLGLIGGSMALDLKNSGLAKEILGIDQNEQHSRQALELGIVDRLISLEELKSTPVEVVIIAIPVSATSQILPKLLDLIGENTVVIDAGSTKEQICKSVTNHPKRNQFVAAHPIAGTENSGPQAAHRGLFRDKTNIICEAEKSSQAYLDRALQLFDHLKMNTIYMEAKEHDKHVAYVSHLSHVSSFLLGHTVLDIENDEKNIFALAGSGFASTVRLAKSSPEMWAPIFEQNAEFLSQALLEYIMHLQRFQYFLMKKDTKSLLNIMQEANKIREVLSGIELKTIPTKQA